MSKYFKYLSYLCIGIVFSISSFYFIININHYKEIRRVYTTDIKNEMLVVELDKKLDTIRDNMTSFNLDTYKGTIDINKMIGINQNLNQCINAFNNETYINIREKTNINIVDVYELVESYENSVLNKCIVSNLYWLTETDLNNQYLVNNKDIIKLHLDNILSSTSYLKKDLLNNSSYFYNTQASLLSGKNLIKDGFNEVMSSYNRVADFVLYISQWYKSEVITW